MATGRLSNKKICIFADFSYEDLEIHYPMIRLQEEGATITIVGTHPAGTKYMVCVFSKIAICSSFNSNNVPG